MTTAAKHAEFLDAHQKAMETMDRSQRDLVIHVLGSLTAYQSLAGGPGLIQMAINEYLIRTKANEEAAKDEPEKAE